MRLILITFFFFGIFLMSSTEESIPVGSLVNDSLLQRVPEYPVEIPKTQQNYQSIPGNNVFGLRNGKPAYLWRGQIDNDDPFCSFVDVEHATRAAIITLQHRFYQGKTIEEVLLAYAPPVENNTESYIQRVQREALISRNDTLSEDNLPKLLVVIAKVESGTYLTEEFIKNIQNESLRKH